MIMETLKESMKRAQFDGYKWAQLKSDKKVYFIAIDKLLEKIEDKFDAFCIQQDWKYTSMIGSIKSKEPFDIFAEIQLHPFPLRK